MFARLLDKILDWMFDFGKCQMGVTCCEDCPQLYDTCMGHPCKSE